MRDGWWLALVAGISAMSAAALVEGQVVSEDVYRGEGVVHPGALAFQLPSAAIIRVSDEELQAPSEPGRTHPGA